MRANIVRNKLLEEIEKIPEDKVSDIYNLVHYFRLGLQSQKANPKKILSLSGSWKDMSEDNFNEFLNEVKIRRKTAFSSRRNI